jgi:hypothetical protein
MTKKGDDENGHKKNASVILVQKLFHSWILLLKE